MHGYFLFHKLSKSAKTKNIILVLQKFEDLERFSASDSFYELRPLPARWARSTCQQLSSGSAS